jgi:hypothetical protein
MSSIEIEGVAIPEKKIKDIKLIYGKNTLIDFFQAFLLLLGSIIAPLYLFHTLGEDRFLWMLLSAIMMTMFSFFRFYNSDIYYNVEILIRNIHFKEPHTVRIQALRKDNAISKVQKLIDQMSDKDIRGTFTAKLESMKHPTFIDRFCDSGSLTP